MLLEISAALPVRTGAPPSMDAIHQSGGELSRLPSNRTCVESAFQIGAHAVARSVAIARGSPPDAATTNARAESALPMRKAVS